VILLGKPTLDALLRTARCSVAMEVFINRIGMTVHNLADGGNGIVELEPKPLCD
jgi:hypothetical protein